jgi:thiol-disulfide isomerase/thioredoxin
MPDSFCPRQGSFRPSRGAWRLFWSLCWLTAGSAFAADSPRPSGSTAVLYLDNGYVQGQLRPTNKPEVLSWQGADFVAPFEFDIKRIDAVYFPDPIKAERPVGDYCFELSAGDVVFGSLLSLTDQEAEIEVPLLGRLHVPRNQLQRFTRKLDDGGMIYRGPNGFADWKLSPAGAWHNEQGQLWTSGNDSSAQSTLTLPPRSAMELVISWNAKPNFALALGGGYRIEAWQRELVLVGETEHQADLASLQPIDNEAGRLHIFVYLDQQAKECLVYSSKGAPLANMKLTDPQGHAQNGLRMTNNRGDIHLERLRIDHWNRGRPLAGDKVDKPRICLVDGSIKYSEIASFDRASKSFRLRGAQQGAISAAQVVDVFLGKASERGPRAITVDYQDSSRFSGQLLKIEGDKIWLASPAARKPLGLPLRGLRSLIVHHSNLGDKKNETGASLEMEGVRLPGNLVDGQEAPGASCLFWRPHASLTASALRPKVRGRVVFRESVPTVSHKEVKRVVRNGRLTFEESTVSDDSSPRTGLTKALYLRTGDMVPCEVTRIDDKGVTYKTPLSDSGLIANDKIKAVVLTLDGRGPVELTKDKRDRLLTLPRMQKDNPPTHLIRSCDGDYLRGRIVEMDDRKLVVEVRTQAKELPRDRVSRIIWLHPDEFEGAPAAKKVSPSGPQPRVQAVHDNGTRLTFHPTQLKDSILSGTSDALGPCRIGISSIDQLLIGDEIEEAVTKTAYQQWKLRYAVEPKFITADAGSAQGGGGTSGLESSLVGKPAPDFELDLLSGERFHLTGHKGKPVVVDFWATWCGPCVQTIPHLAQLHRDSAAGGFDVVAVNLEETPEAIRALLKRLKLDFPVALDRDGAIAARYGVSAIPQTLVIDRDGKVVRHFVGGGPHYAKDLDDALHLVLTGAPAKGGSLEQNGPNSKR